MKPTPWLEAEPYRMPDIPGYGSATGDPYGIFFIPYKGNILYCIATNGGPEFAWEHVSVSTKNRTPRWYEMDFVKDMFWGAEETVMQLHVPKRDHKSVHPHVLHLWRPINMEIPRPPAAAV